MSYIIEMLNKLPYVFAKESDSNIAKLFGIFAQELEELRTTYLLIESYRDIDNAVGATLDNIGKNVKQDRGSLDDIAYRALLKAKIARNISKGDINTIIEIMAAILNISVTDILLQEQYPAGMLATLDNIDTSILANFQQIIDFVKGAVAGGVSLDTLVNGTFSFASDADESETDAEAGFADDTQTTGGYFGGYFT